MLKVWIDDGDGTRRIRELDAEGSGYDLAGDIGRIVRELYVLQKRLDPDEAKIFASWIQIITGSGAPIWGEERPGGELDGRYHAETWDIGQLFRLEGDGCGPD